MIKFVSFLPGKSDKFPDFTTALCHFWLINRIFKSYLSIYIVYKINNLSFFAIIFAFKYDYQPNTVVHFHQSNYHISKLFMISHYMYHIPVYFFHHSFSHKTHSITHQSIVNTLKHTKSNSD